MRNRILIDPNTPWMDGWMAEAEHIAAEIQIHRTATKYKQLSGNCCSSIALLGGRHRLIN